MPEGILRKLLTVAFAFALIVAACGDDDSAVTTATTKAQTTTTTKAQTTTTTKAQTTTTTTTTAETTTTTATTLAPRAQASADTIFFVGGNATSTEFNVFSIKADGSERTQLTEMTSALIPNVSPDRTRVAFFSTDTGEEFVWVMDADGGNLTQVTDYSSATADWHPDGNSLIMNSDSRGEPVDTPDVYHVALDGTVIEQLIDSDATADFDAHFTPDGGMVVFVSTRNGDSDLFLLDLATGEVVEFISGPGEQSTPRISPDGTLLLYTNIEDGNSDIHMTDFGDGPIVKMTDRDEIEDMADWSPDGTQIVFATQRDDGNLDLAIMNVDGSGLMFLAETPEHELFPSWS